MTLQRAEHRRRGGVLFEVMLSMTLFIGAAAFAMSASRSMLGDLHGMLLRQQAVDVARSKFAELQAGLISVQDLQGEQVRGLGSFEAFNEEPGAHPLWVIDVSTTRASFPGFSIVSLTVSQETATATVTPNADGVRITLRQVMQLREVNDEREYEADDLLEDL